MGGAKEKIERNKNTNLIVGGFTFGKISAQDRRGEKFRM